PEVVPYDPTWVRHVLTNSMKAEHYIKSGLNGIPTSVMRLADCIAVATGELEIRDWRLETGAQGAETTQQKHPATPSPLHPFSPSPPHPVTLSPGHPVTRSPLHLFTA